MPTMYLIGGSRQALRVWQNKGKRDLESLRSSLALLRGARKLHFKTTAEMRAFMKGLDMGFDLEGYALLDHESYLKTIALMEVDIHEGKQE
jgi:hypothetical protein